MRTRREPNGPTEERSGALKPTARWLSSWSLRIGLLLLVPMFLLVPWKQQFLWRAGDATFTVHAVRYRFWWNPPVEASLDVGRLLGQLFVLAVLVAAGYRFERGTKRERRRLPGATEAYSEADWSAEIAERDSGAAPQPCPSCGRTGFYGPRQEGGGRRYRSCMFCGFSQNVGEAQLQLRPCVHDCGKVPQVAGAPRITWVAPDVYSYRCEFCDGEVEVVDGLSTNPAYDPQHAWWRVPQGLSHQESVRFWLNNGAPGHVYL